MKLTVLPGENFSCRSCTNCCRSWFVELMPGERERIEKLPWPADDPARKAKIFWNIPAKLISPADPMGRVCF